MISATPTFEVHGIVGGYTGPGVKTVVPPFAEAKVSSGFLGDHTVAAASRSGDRSLVAGGS
jgi:hypothetical protein